MSSAGVGPLCFLRSKVNTAVYQEVLEHFITDYNSKKSIKITDTVIIKKKKSLINN